MRKLRKTQRLRKGRISIPNSRYFITLCTERRKQDLTKDLIATEIISTLRQQQVEGDFDLMCATVMPDHIHLLMRLGNRITLSQVIGKLKTQTRDILQPDHLGWQANFYDHRLRVETTTERFARYIFLNPYRQRLIPIESNWPWWTLNRNYRPEFIASLDVNGAPPSEWLQTGDDIEAIIETDQIDSPSSPAS